MLGWDIRCDLFMDSNLQNMSLFPEMFLVLWQWQHIKVLVICILAFCRPKCSIGFILFHVLCRFDSTLSHLVYPSSKICFELELFWYFSPVFNCGYFFFFHRGSPEREGGVSNVHSSLSPQQQCMSCVFKLGDCSMYGCVHQCNIRISDACLLNESPLCFPSVAFIH